MKIESVTLNGFKTLFRTYNVGSPTILNGPNGCGKSACIEGIIYALTGNVGAGKRLDDVAQYFPADGGTVCVKDDTGNWIRRGIKINPSSGSQSQILQTSGVDSKGKFVLDCWETTSGVLDINEFLTLSAGKKREYVLHLCGVDDSDFDVIKAVATRFAKEVAGSAANASTIEDPSELSPGEIEVISEWSGVLGIGDVLGSYINNDRSLTEVFLELSAQAKNGKLNARRIAFNSKATVKNLDVEAKNADAAADAIELCQAKADSLQSELDMAKTDKANHKSASGNVDFYSKRLKGFKENLKEKEEILDKTSRPGKKPVRGESDTVRLATKKIREITHLQKEIEGQNTIINNSVNKKKEAANGKKAINVLKDDLKTHQNSGIGKLVGLGKECEEENCKTAKHMKIAIGRVSEAWTKKNEALRKESNRLKLKIVVLNTAVEGSEKSATEAVGVKKEMLRKIESVAVVAEKLQKQAKKEDAKYQKLLDDYNERAVDYDTASDRCNIANGVVDQGKEDLKSAKKTLNDLQDPDLDLLTQQLLDAKQFLLDAITSAGVVKAYNEAKELARMATVTETAWKMTEKAIDFVRESHIDSATQKLIDDMNKVLEKTGRKERAYLTLENKRGKPIFELGWKGGTPKTPRSVNAISKGEGTLFCAALSIAITLRASGLKLLLIEADTLDTDNLGLLVKALKDWEEELDTIIVATSTHLPSTVVGWNMFNYYDNCNEEAV